MLHICKCILYRLDFSVIYILLVENSNISTNTDLTTMEFPSLNVASESVANARTSIKYVAYM